MSPDLSLERAQPGTVCGIDEVGRGCLAGCVTAAAVVIPPGAEAALAGVRDSKALSASRREELLAVISGTCLVGIGHADVAEVDALNILQATFLAMTRAAAALPVRPDRALVDGNRVPPRLGIPALAVVKGDARSLSIAAASVVAKVTRDRIMRELDAAFPGYGWSDNAGYGAPAHIAGLSRIGVSPHHRRTFRGVRELLEPALPVQGGFAF